MSKCYFVSGHTDLSTKDFDKYYKSRLEQAAKDPNSTFVMGESVGVDEMAMNYLHELGVEGSRITIYHLMARPRRFVDGCIVKGGFNTHTEKDDAMTRASDEDILFVRSEEESRKMYGKKYRPRISGTEHNALRRARLAGQSCLN